MFFCKRFVRMIYYGLFVTCVIYRCSVWYLMVCFRYARALIIRAIRVTLFVCLTVSSSMLLLLDVLPFDLTLIRIVSLFRFWLKKSMTNLELLSDQEAVTLGAIKECMELIESCRVLARWQAGQYNDDKGRVPHRFIPDITYVMNMGKLQKFSFQFFFFPREPILF